jgi:hypothetical protein
MAEEQAAKEAEHRTLLWTRFDHSERVHLVIDRRTGEVGISIESGGTVVVKPPREWVKG